MRTDHTNSCTGDAATCRGDCDHDFEESDGADDADIAEEQLRMALELVGAGRLAGIIALGGARIVAVCQEELDQRGTA